MSARECVVAGISIETNFTWQNFENSKAWCTPYIVFDI